MVVKVISKENADSLDWNKGFGLASLCNCLRLPPDFACHESSSSPLKTILWGLTVLAAGMGGCLVWNIKEHLLLLSLLKPTKIFPRNLFSPVASSSQSSVPATTRAPRLPICPRNLMWPVNNFFNLPFLVPVFRSTYFFAILIFFYFSIFTSFFKTFCPRRTLTRDVPSNLLPRYLQ